VENNETITATYFTTGGLHMLVWSQLHTLQQVGYVC
jgi:hypothetical protein